MTSRRLPIARIIVGVLALAVSLYCLFGAYANQQRLSDMEGARPLQLPVDFSKVGAYSGLFNQTHNSSHGEEINLLISPPFETTEQLLAAFKGTVANLRITDSGGEAIVDEDLEAADLSVKGTPPDVTCTLRYFHPFPTGRYDFRLTVSKPSVGVAGRQQLLTARYLLCGLEGLPTVIGVLIGTPSAIVTLGIAVSLLRYVRKARKRRQDSDHNSLESELCNDMRP